MSASARPEGKLAEGLRSESSSLVLSGPASASFRRGSRPRVSSPLSSPEQRYSARSPSRSPRPSRDPKTVLGVYYFLSGVYSVDDSSSRSALPELRDLRMLKVIGVGTFSRVFLCLDPKNRKYYALKVMVKEEILRMKQVQHVRAEREILASLSSPFLVKLHRSFRDSLCVYLLEDFVSGGELFTHLRKVGRFEPRVAKFYAAELVVALEYLHRLGIVYRDLKPENVMLDPVGHVRLVDFGFAKRIETRTWTLCGTPEYLAPEVVQSRGHGYAVDWWGLGILIYEMLVGFPPFYDENPFGIYSKIVSGQIWFPSHLMEVEKDLISKLLVRDVTQRLGNLKNGAEDVKNHPWFRGVDWEAVAKRRVKPPVRFPVQGLGDTRYFEQYPDKPFIDGNAHDPYDSLFEDF